MKRLALATVTALLLPAAQAAGPEDCTRIADATRRQACYD